MSKKPIEINSILVPGLSMVCRSPRKQSIGQKMRDIEDPFFAGTFQKDKDESVHKTPQLGIDFKMLAPNGRPPYLLVVGSSGGSIKEITKKLNF